jgi:hypothetical protein
VEPQKPAQGGPDFLPLIGLLFLLLLIIAAVIYWRSRGTKK